MCVLLLYLLLVVGMSVSICRYWVWSALVRWVLETWSKVFNGCLIICECVVKYLCRCAVVKCFVNSHLFVGCTFTGQDYYKWWLSIQVSTLSVLSFVIRYCMSSFVCPCSPAYTLTISVLWDQWNSNCILHLSRSILGGYAGVSQGLMLVHYRGLNLKEAKTTYPVGGSTLVVMNPTCTPV